MTTATSTTVDAPRLVTPLPGPKAAALVARDEQVLSPSYTRPYPLVVARGDGCVIEDVDGNRFLDFTSGLAAASTGHAHPEVVEAIADQAGKFIHMSGTDFHYEPQVELAEKLADLAPGDGPKRVFFTNSGAETTEAAIKLARYHTGRQQLVAFTGAFHGRTTGALSLSGSKSIHRAGFGPLLAGVHRLPYDCDRKTVDEFFAQIVAPEDVAAIIVEPIQGESGYRVPSPEFLPMLRQVCDEYDILLIVDEIQTGMGRTGTMFAVEHDGIEPDVICLAKGIASGMPLGALVSRAEVMDWRPGSHASTFGGNPVCCRAALATIDLLSRELLENAAQRGVQLRAGLERVVSLASGIVNVRGRGLMLGVDVTNGARLDPFRRDALIEDAFQQGLILVGCGTAAIRFCPGLCVTASQVGAAVDVFRKVATR